MPPFSKHLLNTFCMSRYKDSPVLNEPINPQMPAACKQVSTVPRDRHVDRAKGQLTQQRMEQRASRNIFPAVMPRPAPGGGKNLAEGIKRIRAHRNGPTGHARWEEFRVKGSSKPC